MNRIAICVAVLLLFVPVLGNAIPDLNSLPKVENQGGATEKSNNAGFIPNDVNTTSQKSIDLLKWAETHCFTCNAELVNGVCPKCPRCSTCKAELVNDVCPNGPHCSTCNAKLVNGVCPQCKKSPVFAIACVAGVAITLALIIVIPRLLSKCPRCGKILHGGNCSACFWPKPRCELCQSSPLFDDVCPNCGAHPDDFPDIRYNDSSDSKGRKTGGFGIVYSAIVKDGDGYSKGYMLKRSKTYREMNDFIMKDVEFKARRDGIPFEADVLSYLQDKSFEGAPKIIARGDELNSAKGLGPWYLMEKARGARMDAWMRAQQGGFSSKNQGRLLIELAKSLLGLHELGVCHRDFKPENVFWNEKRQIATIIDYGSAAMPKGFTENPIEHEVAAVSKFWAPPEQFHSRLSDNDETADIFSFGVIFCAVVLGREHLNRSNPIESYKERISAIVGPSITDLLFNRLLASDRNNRRNSLSEFVELLSKEWGY